MATSSTTVGINVNGIEKLRKAISNYQAAIKKKANIGAKKSTIEKAIKGSKSESSLKTMCNKIENEINTMLKELDKYSKYLSTLAATYKKADSDNKSFSVAVGIGGAGVGGYDAVTLYGVPAYPSTPPPFEGQYPQIQSDYGIPGYTGQYSQVQSDYGVPSYPGTAVGHYSQVQSDYGVPSYPGTAVGQYSQVQSDYGVPSYPGTAVGHYSQVQSKYGIPGYSGSVSTVQSKYGVPGYSCDKK
jgi:hypothetical protein